MKWGEDFQDSLRTEAHDETTQSSIAALDAEETSSAHAVEVALDAVIDARYAVKRARDASRAAHATWVAALAAEAHS